MGAQLVAFDLETTGLDTDSDAIIEIGAVRFEGDRVLDTFSTLVNPRRPLPHVIQDLTGITDRDLAPSPPLEVVAPRFEEFIEGAVLVGHNACGFDVPFLDRAGIRHTGIVYDTQPLAAMLLPGLTEYGLVALAAHFGIDFPVQHRALPDAEAARSLFLRLQERALELPADVLAQVAQWLTPTALPYRAFFRDIWEASLRGIARAAEPRAAVREPHRPLNPRPDPQPLDVQEPLSVLASAAGRTDLFPDFHERRQQNDMLAAVTQALNDGRRLIVEAGTGTGKSLAYLIPSACYSLTNEERVVVSTATINLQEQLVRKDIPTLQRMLPPGPDGLRACQLKGRRNYLCLRRFEALRASGSMTDEEALLVSKVLIWLRQTETGDRAELRLSQAEEAVWSRISADGADCTSDNSPYMVDGSCFLQKARRRAESSHVVVVNHALLLSDVASGGFVLPPYRHLVIDEAHHLEEEAGRQFGFRGGERELSATLDRVEALSRSVDAALGSSPLGRGSQLGEVARSLRQSAGNVRARLREMCDTVRQFISQHNASADEPRLLLDRTMRVQPDWPGVEIAWENLRLLLLDLIDWLDRVRQGLEQPEGPPPVNQEILVSDARGLAADLAAMVEGFARAIEEDDAGRVVWAEVERAEAALLIAWVPLVVGDLLNDLLYKDRRAVVLTGASLRSDGGFDFIQQRLGLLDADTLALGSPFDYQRAALVLLPRDMPEPNRPDYLDALGRAIIDLARASHGRALVLFTSHGSLQGAYRLVEGPLREEGITVLAQSLDGSPRQLVRALQSAPNTVLLGTASFWEGVDIPGEALSLLVLARLPFAVPTDPVFAARSALYEDSFNGYALPQAVLRFKQGFGRLIRTRTDRGVLVVLDQRIASKSYGPVFLQSLPSCTTRHAALREMPPLVERWLAAPRAVPTIAG